MKNTYLFELKNGDFITSDNTTAQRAYNHILRKGYAEADDVLTCWHVAKVDGIYVKFGLNLINQLDK